MYENKTCEYCGELFAKNDDIVVCPECGAPYHRKCWQAHGKCAHESEHASGYTYAGTRADEAAVPAEEEDYIEKIKTQILSQSAAQQAQTEDDSLYCANCGAKLIEGDDYCVLCGHHKGDPVRGNGRKNAQKDPLGGFAPDDEIGGERVSNLALLVRTNAAKFLPRMQRVSQRKVKIGWSWPAFFFGYLYLFFRKLYKYGMIVIMAQVLIFNVMNYALGDPLGTTMTTVSEIYSKYAQESENGALSQEEYEKQMQSAQEKLIQNGALAKTYVLFGGSLLATNLICALLFDYLYFKHCKDTVARMDKSAEILGGMSKSEYRLNLLARGGISIFGIFIGYFAKMAVEQFVAMLLSFFE